MTIAKAFKAETLRLAKKVVRAETASLRSSVAAQRKQIAALKRQIGDLQRQSKATQSQTKKLSVQVPDAAVKRRKPRFSPELMALRRKKLGLSQAQFGKLLGVSAISILKYEKGSTIPRARTLEAFQAISSLGKRAALARIGE